MFKEKVKVSLVLKSIWGCYALLFQWLGTTWLDLHLGCLRTRYPGGKHTVIPSPHDQDKEDKDMASQQVPPATGSCSLFQFWPKLELEFHQLELLIVGMKKSQNHFQFQSKRKDCKQFLSDPGIPGVRSMGPSFSNWLTTPCWDLTDATLADEDTDSILTDNGNRAIQGNMAMHVTLPGWKICN